MAGALSSGFAGCCQQGRTSGGVPASDTRPELCFDLASLIDGLASERERMELLLAMNGGDTSLTILDAAKAGGYRDVTRLRDAGATADPGDVLCAYSRSTSEQGILSSLVGGDCTAIDKNKALIQAASRGHCGNISLLISQGADVNWLDGQAIGTAALLGQLDAVRVLIEARARPTAQSLNWATKHGHWDVVRVLLEAVDALA